jgi:hypothetical protein
MKDKIEEIVLLAKDKGFEAKTMSTKFTMCGYLGINKANLSIINDTCDYLLLAEMQKWLREKHNVFCEVQSVNYTDINRMRFESCVYSELYEDEYTDDIDEKDVFDTYELALLDALSDALKDLKINKK